MLTNNPRTYKGDINLNSDFPDPTLVKDGDTYVVETDVTDNDPAKTNTGQSFVASCSIFWNATTSLWELTAPVKIWEALNTAIAVTSAPVTLNPGVDRSSLLLYSSAGGVFAIQAYIESAWRQIATIPIAATTAEAETLWYYAPKIRLVFTPAGAGTVSAYIYNTKVN